MIYYCICIRCVQYTYMKGVGNKRRNEFKLPFLRYSTGESGMILELFSHRPFIKTLFCRLTIWISRFRITEYFIGNFLEISRKFSGNFSENSYTPTYPPYPPPTPLTHTQHPKLWTHSELQIHFSQKHNLNAFARLFPTPFTCIYIHMKGVGKKAWIWSKIPFLRYSTGE